MSSSPVLDELNFLAHTHTIFFRRWHVFLRSGWSKAFMAGEQLWQMTPLRGESKQNDIWSDLDFIVRPQ